MPDIENYTILKLKHDNATVEEALDRALSNVYMEKAVEGYFHDGSFYRDADHTELISPQLNVLYMDISYNPAFGYRWSGTRYCGVTTSDIFESEEERQAAELRREQAELSRQDAERERTIADENRRVIGAWSPEEYYYVGNRVTIGGSCYECIQDNINHDPRDSNNNYAFWVMAASAGDSGDGSGDMTKSVYDPQNRRRDIFEYTDSKMRPFDRALMFQTASGKFLPYQFTATQTDLAEMHSIAYGNGVYRALGRWNNPYAASQYSYDSMEWIKDGVPKNWSTAGNILYGKNRFVGYFGNSSYGGCKVWMDDGDGWTSTIIENGEQITSSHKTTGLPYWGDHSAVFDGTKFIFLGSTSMNSTTVATFSSENGLSYERAGSLPVSARWCHLTTATISGTAYCWAVEYNGNIAVTTDHGETWDALTPIPKAAGKYIYCVEYIPQGNGYLIAAGNGKAIYVSEDFGKTWMEKTLSSTDMYIRCIPYAFGKIYIRINGSIKKSADLGDTWTDTGINVDMRFWIFAEGKLTISSMYSTCFSVDGNNFVAAGGSYLSDHTGSPITDAVATAMQATRTAVMTYIGTGTYGEDNPCSLTADYPIKAAICMGNVSGRYMDAIGLTTSYVAGVGFNAGGTVSARKSADGKTFEWYGTSAADQLNESGTVYRMLVFM